MADWYGVELFDAGGSNPRLRWRDPDGGVAERRLNRQEVQDLVARVSAGYAVTAPDLPGLGAGLFEWLDGPTERWVKAAQNRARPMAVGVDAEERLRGLPWEVMFNSDAGGFLAVHPSRPVSPVRVASSRVSDTRERGNRPLRVLFMASSPVGVEPVLDYEKEEWAILDAAAGRIELVVEESGSLDGLRDVLTWFGEGHFDVLHLSGHGVLAPQGALFVMEASDGTRSDASAAEIATAIGGLWPGLVFVSGCHTAGTPQDGLVASMAEALVDAGAPAVLGWALPVGDVSANQLAGKLFERLADGAPVGDAVTDARRALHDSHSGYWHLLRFYTDKTPLTPLVTPPGTKGRQRWRARSADTLFLDPEGQVKVTKAVGFVGRRRELQRLLLALRPDDSRTGPQVAVLHGMGGLGKSTLTARLLSRLTPTHPHQAVWVGRIDETSITGLTGRLNLPDPDQDQQVNQLLNRQGVSLADRVRYVLDGPLRDEQCVFVFDDFEDGNLEPDGSGGFRCTPEALAVLNAFGSGIERTGTASRVVVTCRHDFPLPPGLRVVRQPLSGLDGADLAKKLRLTQNLGPTSTIDPAIKNRAIAAAAGIPRLLERLDSLVGTDGQIDDALAAIDATEVKYREELTLQKLLDRQPTGVRRVIALAAIYQIAVPREALEALVPDRSIQDEIDAAVKVGLLQAGIHPATGETRYLVSPLLSPLLDQIPERLDEQDLRQAQEHGARYLFHRWVQPDAQTN